MKRFIDVPMRRADGRTITQRYPARSVGEVLWDLPYCEPMACIGGCGYIRCSQTGPCAPAPIAAEPPADELPEGWQEDHAGAFEHVSKAYVYSAARGWYWWTAADAAAQVTEVVHEPLPTRDAAMQAALASVQPDEPYGCVNRRTDSPRECVESGHYYCDAFKSKPQPAEPTLRAGWVRRSEFNEVYQHEYARRVFRLGDEWRVMGDSSHPTLEAAMQRAEVLARGEP